MSTTATFDTLAAARTLESAGMPADQAEAVVKTVTAAVTEGVATKADIAELRTDMADLRGDLRADIAAMETRLIRWAIGAALAAAGLAVAAVRLLA
ncbi:MAG: DUF1640 domain-containing protein [Acidobacteria bacterium]|nr:DUF1640 domain-containing protein [Acidobacteriota bacterium]MCY3972174.1 DUF1640 domain-containing protein [Acidobacteriota bacterium]